MPSLLTDGATVEPLGVDEPGSPSCSTPSTSVATVDYADVTDEQARDHLPRFTPPDGFGFVPVSASSHADAMRVREDWVRRLAMAEAAAQAGWVTADELAGLRRQAEHEHRQLAAGTPPGGPRLRAADRLTVFRAKTAARLQIRCRPAPVRVRRRPRRQTPPRRRRGGGRACARSPGRPDAEPDLDDPPGAAGLLCVARVA